MVRKKSLQANTIIGNYCYSYSDPKRVPMFLVSNILAGPGMNSRLNMQLREHHGLSYNIESNFTTYQDTGLFSIFFSSDHEKVDFAVDMIFRELDNMRNNKLGTLQLSRAKKQLIGQNLLLAVISLPGNMFESTSIPTCLLVLFRIY